MSEEERKQEIIKRSHGVGERLAKYVAIQKLEALASKVESEKFRKSTQYKIFINSL